MGTPEAAKRALHERVLIHLRRVQGRCDAAAGHDIRLPATPRVTPSAKHANEFGLALRGSKRQLSVARHFNR